MNTAVDNEITRLTIFYDRLRGQVEHENELYNQRIIWLITIQAFLFATVGLLLQARMTASPEWWMRLDGLVLTICGLGVLIALICNRLLDNARRALRAIASMWEERAKASSHEAASLFPAAHGVSGGPTFTVLRSGHLPKVFVVAWVLVAFLLLVPSEFLQRVAERFLTLRIY